MERSSYRFSVQAEDQAAAGRASQALADTLREAHEVLEVNRQKIDNNTMDLGSVVNAIATSGATLAIARGIAAWLQARKGASITIERDAASGNIKAAVAGIDAEAAVRIAEIVRS
jgi:hypothetical protein